jgi:hypothetical protein
MVLPDASPLTRPGSTGAGRSYLQFTMFVGTSSGRFCTFVSDKSHFYAFTNSPAKPFQSD